MVALERLVVLVFWIVVILAIVSCATYHGEYSVLSNRSLDLKDFDPRKSIQRRVYAEGVSERRIYCLFPDRDGFPSLDEAIDQVLAEGEGDLVLNAQVIRWHWYVPMIYGTSGWKVVGDVVDTGSRGAKLERVGPRALARE